MRDKTAIIIGASRGIGLGLVGELVGRGYQVIASERSPSAALHELADQHSPQIEIVSCDVTRPESYADLARGKAAGSLDLLILNAGIYGPKSSEAQSLSALENEAMADIMLANAIGPVQTALALLPLVRDGGRVGMLTSKMGSIDDSSGGVNYYRVSKVAQNMLARSLFAQHCVSRNIAVLSLHPGWVQTEMGGPNALVTIEQSASGLADRLEEERPVEHAFIDYTGTHIGW